VKTETLELVVHVEIATLSDGLFWDYFLNFDEVFSVLPQLLAVESFLHGCPDLGEHAFGTSYISWASSTIPCACLIVLIFVAVL